MPVWAANSVLKVYPLEYCGCRTRKVNAPRFAGGQARGCFHRSAQKSSTLSSCTRIRFFPREQAGHLIVLMRRALIEERVDLLDRLRGVCVGRDRQPRVAQYKLIRPGQREVIGRGRKTLVLIPARLPRVPVQRFGHRCIQARRDQLGQREKQPKRRAGRGGAPSFRAATAHPARPRARAAPPPVRTASRSAGGRSSQSPAPRPRTESRPGTGKRSKMRHTPYCTAA